MRQQAFAVNGIQDSRRPLTVDPSSANDKVVSVKDAGGRLGFEASHSRKSLNCASLSAAPKHLAGSDVQFDFRISLDEHPSVHLSRRRVSRHSRIE